MTRVRLSPHKFFIVCMFMMLSLGAVSLTHAGIRLKPQPGTVALTFDDGPNPKYTPQVLQILKRYHIHAVFFVTARLARIYPNVVRQIVADGNIVANHSVTHPRLTRLSSKRLDYEVGGAKRIIARVLGYSPNCFRPPFLATNRRVERVIRNYGMYSVMGMGTKDYRLRGSRWLTRYVLRHVRSGAILIFHDGPSRRAQTVRALPAIIEGIKRKGLGFSLICN